MVSQSDPSPAVAAATAAVVAAAALQRKSAVHFVSLQNEPWMLE